MLFRESESPPSALVQPSPPCKALREMPGGGQGKQSDSLLPITVLAQFHGRSLAS